jgi:hypothetical protein
MKKIILHLHHSEILKRGIALLFLSGFLLFNLTQFASAQATTGLPPGQLRVFNDDILGFNIEPDTPAGCPAASGGNGADLAGADNIKKAMSYFITVRGLTAAQAAGIVGNLMVEDPGLVPTTVQGGGTAQAPISGKGYGIGQWTDGGRQAGLVSLAKTEAPPNNTPASLTTQLDFVWQELNTTYKGALADLKAGTVRVPGKSAAYNAAVSIMINYEAPKEKSPTGPNAIARGGNADQIVGGGGGAAVGSTGGAAGCAGAGAVACNTAGPSAAPGANAGVSQVRQDVVCLAQEELKAWQQPGVKPAELCSKYGAGKPCEEWCADFVSWIYDKAKYPVQPEPNWKVGLVQGLWDIGKLNKNFHFHPAAGYTPKPGDIVIHKQNGTSHTNIVISVAGAVITTIGGDQGSGPYGGPNSRSVVSQGTQKSSTDQDTTGFVSPD